MDLFSRKNMILLREMIKTDFKLRYQGSLIGHLWSILETFYAIYNYVFSICSIFEI